jgi:hypothetical protein
MTKGQVCEFVGRSTMELRQQQTGTLIAIRAPRPASARTDHATRQES